jgi:ATP adenylyltransferase
MDYLWTPWRYQYMEQAVAGKQPPCIFCDAAARTDDDVTLVVHRGTACFVILNRFPYTSGHVMVVPYRHVAELALCEPSALSEWRELLASSTGPMA